MAVRALGNSVYRLSNGSVLNLSQNNGHSWVRVSPQEARFDAQWLAQLNAGAVLAIGFDGGWRFEPGQRQPLEFTLPRDQQTGGVAFRKVLEGPDGPYLLMHGTPTLMRVSPTEPWSSWKTVRPPMRRIADADSTGTGFAAVGWDDSLRTIVLDFDEHGSSAVVLPFGHPEMIACQGQACAAYVGGHVLTRATAGGAWRDYGDMFSVLKWFVANCDAKMLKDLPKLLPEKDDKSYYRPVGLAFDGHTVAVAATWAESDVSELAASLLLNPDGVAAVRYGYADVWSPRSGVFWFLGPRILPIGVH